jgi:hypothetical protein
MVAIPKEENHCQNSLLACNNILSYLLGICENNNNEVDCLRDPSSLDGSRTQCLWDSIKQTCALRPPPRTDRSCLLLL